MSPGPLEGLLVVDATRARGVAGPLAAMFFADFGADVVKLWPSESRTPESVVFDRGKRVTSEPSDAVLRSADLVITDDPGWSPSADDTRLVVLSVLPYLDGEAPWAGGGENDPLLAARMGTALRQASIEDVPVESIYPHLSTVQGIWAAACGVAALVERASSGLGQRVVVGGVHGALVASAAAFNFDAAAEVPATRRSPRGSGGSVPFYRTYRCRDGEWLFLAALTPRFTSMAFEALGLTGLMTDERLGGRGRAAMLTPEHAGWVTDTIASVFATRSRDEWLAALGAAGCPAGPLLSRDDWLDHPQLDAIGMRLETADGVVMPGQPIHLSPFGRAEDRRPASSATKTGSGDGGPLAGVRVIDLGAIIAGPFGASLLGELGADVIKVEPPSGDSFRGPGFAAYNKGQRGIVLDLQRPEGRDALLRLVADADVVLDNYRPGVLSRLRLTHADLVEVNPSIITLSVTGFGEGGPLGSEPGFDPVLQAMSGMMRAQGGPDGDPVFFTVPVNDVAAASSSALAVCLTLLHRERTGEGSRGWTSLAGMSALLQSGALVRYAGRPPAAVGSTDHPGPSDDDRYHRVADGWVRVRGRAFDESWSSWSREAVVEALTADGVPAAPASSARELVEQLAAADALHPDPRPRRETWWTPGRHARFSRTERTGTLVAPSLGEHTREVLAEAGFSDDEVAALLASGAAVAAADG